MTPQERQLVVDLFDRLATLEQTPRDTDAERTIADGLARAPHAIYPLVQTVLVQDEALRRADARIRELEGHGEPMSGGFLDNMRSALFGGRDGTSTSVPSVRQNVGADPRWNGAAPAATATSGNSFLGTAAASAVGVIGGMMMANMIGSLFGGSSGQAFASPAPAERTPWDQQSGNSDLARDAGLGDIAGGRGAHHGADDSRRAGLFDSGGHDDDFDADFGGDGGGD
ncbi:MAG: DUF2076 domain-containing protein [Pseudolabrys sp.]